MRNIIFENDKLYNSPIMDAIVRLFKKYDTNFKCISPDTDWVFKDLQPIIDILKKLINAIGFNNKYKSIVFVACVTVIYRKCIDIKNITNINVLINTHFRYLDIIRKCMLSVNPNFWQSWFVWGFNNGFYTSCLTVENILFKYQTILNSMNRSCFGYPDIHMVFEMFEMHLGIVEQPRNEMNTEKIH